MNRRGQLRVIAGGVILAAGVILVCLGIREPAAQAYFLADDRFGFLLFGFAVMLLGAIILSGSLAEWFSRPITAFIDLVYFGKSRAEAPPVTLRLAQVYRQQGRHAEAIAECERQLEWHPSSLELWREIITNARCIGSGEMAAGHFRRAVRRLRGDDRTALAGEFPAFAL